MAIRIEITGDNANAIMKEMFNLCSGVFSTYQNPPSAEETEAAGVSLVNEPTKAVETPSQPESKEQAAPAPQQKAEKEAAHPEEDKKGVPDNPFMGYAKEVVQCISEDQHNELKGICSRFVAAKPANRAKLRTWLTDHGVKRLSELPEKLYEDFKKWLEANKNAN